MTFGAAGKRFKEDMHHQDAYYEKTLKELLKVKLGTLSSPLEKQLTNTSLEKLYVLILNIFNINSEEDVLKIIH